MGILYSTSNSNQWSSQNTEHWDWVGIEGDVSLAKTIKVIKIHKVKEVIKVIDILWNCEMFLKSLVSTTKNHKDIEEKSHTNLYFPHH